MLRKINKIIIIIDIILLIIYYVYGYFKKTYNDKLVTSYFTVYPKETEVTKTNIINNSNTENYLGILEIPKINLKRGFYDINNKLNNVNKNIEVLKGSTMPNNSSHILAIASHSGNGLNAYFKNLHKLKENDEVLVYYQNYLYNYQVKEIYEVDKNGQINILKSNNNVIILTTCSKNKNKQLLVIAYLQEK